MFSPTTRQVSKDASVLLRIGDILREEFEGAVLEPELLPLLQAAVRRHLQPIREAGMTDPNVHVTWPDIVLTHKRTSPTFRFTPVFLQHVSDRMRECYYAAPPLLLRWFLGDWALFLLYATPLEYIEEEAWDALVRARFFVLGWDVPGEDSEVSKWVAWNLAREGARKAEVDWKWLHRQVLWACHARNVRKGAEHFHQNAVQRRPETLLWAYCRLGYLIDVWASCGERSPHLLQNGDVPLPYVSFDL